MFQGNKIRGVLVVTGVLWILKIANFLFLCLTKVFCQSRKCCIKVTSPHLINFVINKDKWHWQLLTFACFLIWLLSFWLLLFIIMCLTSCVVCELGLPWRWGFESREWCWWATFDLYTIYASHKVALYCYQRTRRGRWL